MSSQLHPTLKACHCGYIGVRIDLFRHLDQTRTHYNNCHMTAGEFWADHGEIPLNEDDPRVADIEAQLKRSIQTRQEIIDSL